MKFTVVSAISITILALNTESEIYSVFGFTQELHTRKVGLCYISSASLGIVTL
jgi:hypothetical protein